MDKETTIPFGAKDSELKGWEYTIPENMEAEIKNGKIIVRPKESEDEKIRKEILSFLKEGSPYYGPGSIRRQKWVAYFEKQKEPTPVKFDDDIEVGLDRALQIVKAAKGNLCGYQSDDGVYECCHAIQTLERILNNGIECKSVKWSEEDEEKVNRLSDLVVSQSSFSSEWKKELLAWLKALRPQSQRRDTYYDIIHSILAMLKDIDFMQITPQHRVSLLNDIRVKCKDADECATILDEHHWKPRKDHFQGLRRGIMKVEKGSDAWNSLTDLYEQLEKL